MEKAIKNALSKMTDKQINYYLYVQNFINEHKRIPTTEEKCKHFNLDKRMVWRLNKIIKDLLRYDNV